MITRILAKRRARRGNILIEFSIGASLFVTAFTATFQYGYIFYRYNTLENAVHGAARYAALAPYDSNSTTPSTAFNDKVKNMVVYGKPTAGTNPVVPGLSTSHVVLTPTFTNGVPTHMKVHISGFTINGIFGSLNCTNKPVVRYAYQGRWAPPPVENRRRGETAMRGILRRQTNGKRRGSGMLETALLSMIFSAMLIGTFDFGQFLFVHQALVERARSSARWGALKNGSDIQGTVNMVLYNQSTTPSVGTATYFGLEPSMVTVTLDDANTNDARVTLKIDNYPYKMISPYTAGTYVGPQILVSVPLGGRQ